MVRRGGQFFFVCYMPLSCFKPFGTLFVKLQILGLGLGVDFTFTWDNNNSNNNNENYKNNPHLNFFNPICHGTLGPDRFTSLGSDRFTSLNHYLTMKFCIYPQDALRTRLII